MSLAEISARIRAWISNHIAVNGDSSKAYVTLQEANALGVLNLRTNDDLFIIRIGCTEESINIPVDKGL